MHNKFYLFCIVVPTVPVLLTLVADLAMGNDVDNDVIVRRTDGASL